MKTFIKKSTTEEKLRVMISINDYIISTKRHLENNLTKPLGIFESMSERKHTVDIQQKVLVRLNERFIRLKNSL